MLETLSAPTLHPIRKTVDTVETSVLLLSAPQVAAVLNMLRLAEKIAFSLTTIRAIVGLVILSVQKINFVGMEAPVSIASTRGGDLALNHVRLPMRVS